MLWGFSGSLLSLAAAAAAGAGLLTGALYQCLLASASLVRSEGEKEKGTIMSKVSFIGSSDTWGGLNPLMLKSSS